MLTKNIQEFKTIFSSSYGRLLGLDVGRRKIGMALSDESRTIATPYDTLLRKTMAKDLAVIKGILEKHQIQGIVAGWPVMMDGREGESCIFVRTFLEKLQADCTVPILLQDERFSTAAVQRVLRETSMTREKKESLDDKMAAGYMLQGALDQMR